MIPSAAMSDIGGRIYHRLFTAAAISARTYVITWDCSHWPLQVGGRGVMETCRLLMAAALSSRSYVIKIVFSLLMSPSLVCWIGPTAVRKKAARVPLGRGLSRQMYFQDTYSNLWKVKLFSGNNYSLKSNTYFWGTVMFVQDGFLYLMVTRRKLTVRTIVMDVLF